MWIDDVHLLRQPLAGPDIKKQSSNSYLHWGDRNSRLASSHRLLQGRGKWDGRY